MSEKELSSDQLLYLIEVGINAYYDDLIRKNYPYAELMNTILDIDGDLALLKTQLAEWLVDKNELLGLIKIVDLLEIYQAFAKDPDDDAMIAKFESAISFTTEGQKYAFLSAINSI